MQACIADERERQDKRLNAAYKALIGAVSEERKAELRNVQRKWIAFRDANLLTTKVGYSEEAGPMSSAFHSTSRCDSSSDTNTVPPL